MIAVELRKLMLRPRMWVSVLLLCLLPAIVAVFLATADFPPPPGQGGAFLSAVLRNGSLYPAAASSPASRRTESAVRERSGPRVNGTTQ